MASTEEFRRNLIIIVRLAVAARWRVIERRLRDLKAVFRAKLGHSGICSLILLVEGHLLMALP